MFTFTSIIDSVNGVVKFNLTAAFSNLIIEKLMQHRKIFGIGINDADYVVQIKQTVTGQGENRVRREIWICPFYRKWKAMMNRCYGTRSKGYEKCTVCEDWLLFSNFKRWMETQDWEGQDLDKDLFSDGSSMYSPNTCTFIPEAVNAFMAGDKAVEGRELPVGVHWCKREGKFVAQIKFLGKRKFLGYFSSPAEAEEAYRQKKWEAAQELSKLLSGEVKEKFLNHYRIIVEEGHSYV